MRPKGHPPVVEEKKTESFSKRTTFYVNYEWEAGAKPGQGTYIRGQMYVESLEPPERTQRWPIVLIHGDYHSSQVVISNVHPLDASGLTKQQIWLTKPNGDPGWASYFLSQGFQVYLVDLPGTGKSNNLSRVALDNTEIKSIKASQIERELTATERFNHVDNLRWPTALKHDKWPGVSPISASALLAASANSYQTGIRGDKIFDRYCASLTSLVFSSEERQTLAQNAVKSLLRIIAQKAILIGEGAGATASWLAADVEPEFVAGVVAIEPPGPPFCNATVERDGKRKFDSFTSFNPNRLKYGLSTIPLTYSPAARPESLPTEETKEWHPLDLALFVHTDTGKAMVLQCSSNNMPVGFHFWKQITRDDGAMRVRKLTNLSKVRHVIFTGEASSHSTYDGSTLHFMQQAGLTVDCGFLERYKTTGNGHLMFLETNSDEIAAHIVRWIQNKAGHVDKPIVMAEEEIAMPSRTVPSAEVIDVDEDSQTHLIDLTDYPQFANYDCTNDNMRTVSGAEDVLSPASSSVFQNCGEMPPPPLPSRINAAKTPSEGPATSMANNAKRQGHEFSARDSEYSTPLGIFDQGYVSVSSSSSKRAQATPQQLVSKQPGIGGPGSPESSNFPPSQGTIDESLANSAANSYRASMAKYLSPPAAEVIPQQRGFKRSGIRISRGRKSEEPQRRNDSLSMPSGYPIQDPLQELLSEMPSPTPAQVNSDVTGFERNEIGVDGSQESTWPSRGPASSNKFSTYRNLNFFQKPWTELPPPTAAHTSPGEPRFKRNKIIDVDGRQESNWPVNDHASFDTFSVYPTQQVSCPSPISIAAQVNFQQPRLMPDELSEVVRQESNRAQASHDNFYTDYRFDFSAPQTMGQDGNQNTPPSAPHGTRYFQQASLHTAPFQQQQLQQPPTLSPPVTEGIKAESHDGSYTWSVQSGHASSSVGQVPRRMPDLEAGDAATNVGGPYSAHTGAGNEPSLDGMPRDFDFDGLLQDYDDDDLQGYAY
ncbi:hypothetical protein LLEC1_07666 [Akanthomyces lecanii]|uniref:Uncharacterized protein n=1 Tax=Cordyceps confragosa TaxID=2714763 RepID=A0A179IEN5_CORDF|nr:hypothetical protein LLEC1_07666 [Akanthomyces lecanii]